MIAFEDLFTQTAGISEDHKNLSDAKPLNVVVVSFVVEDTFISKYIVKQGIQCSVFKHSYQFSPVDIGKSVLDYPEVNLRLILPELKFRYSVFHPKVLLIKFDHFLRVVITTANMLEKDWTELGQIIWFQDFRYTAEPINSQFKEDLKRFFNEICPSDTTVTVKKTPGPYQPYAKPENALNNDTDTGKKFNEVIRGEINFDEYDFSDCMVDLIATVQGRYNVDRGEAKNYGICRMSSIMSDCEEFKPTDNTEVTYQCTSFGKIYTKMLNDFIQCILGDKIDYGNIPLKRRLKFIFPTEKDVLASHLGDTVNCLKLREDFWDHQEDFPRYLFHKYEYKDIASKFDKNVHHSKVMIIKEKDAEIDDNSAIYIGSHNMSGGAWGTFQRAGKTLY